METLKHFFVAFISFIVLDFLWLGYVVKSFNLRQLAQIGRIENGDFSILYFPAVLVYVLMAAAVVFFNSSGKDTNLVQTFLSGALLGLIIYGVYDLTNLSILKNYPLAFAIADMAWGTVVFGVVSVIVRKFV